jgi:hypothetical protein
VIQSTSLPGRTFSTGLSDKPLDNPVAEITMLVDDRVTTQAFTDPTCPHIDQALTAEAVSHRPEQRVHRWPMPVLAGSRRHPHNRPVDNEMTIRRRHQNPPRHQHLLLSCVRCGQRTSTFQELRQHARPDSGMHRHEDRHIKIGRQPGNQLAQSFHSTSRGANGRHRPIPQQIGGVDTTVGLLHHALPLPPTSGSHTSGPDGTPKPS